MTTTLSAYLFAHNLVDILYPFVPSIHSALALTRFLNGSDIGGRVWVAICDCSDDTEVVIRAEFGEEVKSGELRLIYHEWGKTHYTQVEIGNFLLDHIGESTEYALKLDADEIVHQDSFEDFKLDLEAMHNNHWVLGRPHYTHLLDESRETDFIYRSKAVISRTSSGIRFSDNDACALGGAQEAQTRLEIEHLGKYQAGRRREALLKEITFTRLYADLGFPDPRVVAQLEQGYIDYNFIFENAKNLGQIRPWLGTHPIFVQEWINEAQRRDVEFLEQIKQGKVEALQTEKWWK
jgi:hypothetical protein